MLACGIVKDGRDQATGKGLEGSRAVPEPPPPPPPPPPADNGTAGQTAGGTGNGNGTATGGETGGQGNGGATDVGATGGGEDTKPLTASSKTVEQCTAEKKAWTPAEKDAAGDVKPAYCGEPLVEYCCSEPEIFRRFPQQETKLKELFEQQKAKGLKLYHCSSTADPKRTTFHFGRIGGDPALIHGTVFTTSTPFAPDPPTLGQCPPQLGTNDLKVGG